jgi:hypothetical protein
MSVSTSSATSKCGMKEAVAADFPHLSSGLIDVSQLSVPHFLYVRNFGLLDCCDLRLTSENYSLQRMI